MHQAGARALFGVDATYAIPNDAMAPALQVNDVVGATVHYGQLRRGDVVVFPIPAGVAGGKGLLIKRVIGLAGDTVAGAQNTITVNGVPLNEPYLAPGTDTTDFASATVAPGEVFVLGDNRAHSEDSRLFGPIPTSGIVAVAVKIVLPKGRAGPLPGSPRT